MANHSFTLPDLGEGIREAEVLAVLVARGAKVTEGEVILEVETDKAAVEIPSPITGTVRDILVGVGDLVQVGEVLLVFAEGAGAAASAAAGADERSVEAVAGPGRETRPKVVPASPATRRLARELGVDLSQVSPTGTGGIVLADDVRRVAEGGGERGGKPEAEPLAVATGADQEAAGAAAGLPDFSVWGEVVRQPFRSIRRATAERMRRSWSEIPHVTCQDTVDVTRLEEFRRRHKAEIEAVGGRLTMTIFAMKALATALKNYPHFNASLDLAAGEIIVKKYYHIGVAVDTGHGLMVPVVRDVDRKSIREIAIELQQLLTRARQRSISRDELQGGTITITNAGAIGGGFFSPIINHPEIAILGLGQARLQPAVVSAEDGSRVIAPRYLMPVMLCFDHRVVDGADAVRFLQVIIDSLGDPDELLITMT